MENSEENLYTFGEHLAILRQMLVRIIIITFLVSIIVFFLKEPVFDMLLAPCEHDFITFELINKFLSLLGSEVNLFPETFSLITTDISSQFIAHLTASTYIAFLLVSPYIVYELFKYISPALFLNERKACSYIMTSIVVFFIVGLIISYFIIFPISARFLATYNVSEKIIGMITLESYISLFTTLSLMMGLFFQLPIISLLLAKVNIINYVTMKRYRKHAFVIILIIAAIITPPDALTLVIVSFPLYILYELSIYIVKVVNHGKSNSKINLSLL